MIPPPSFSKLSSLIFQVELSSDEILASSPYYNNLEQNLPYLFLYGAHV